MNDDSISQAKHNAKNTLSKQRQETSKQIEKNKAETSRLQYRNNELEASFGAYNQDKATQKEKDQFHKDTQEHKGNSSRIQQYKQELPQLEQKDKKLEQQEFKSLAAEAKDNDAKVQFLEVTEGTGELTSTNQSIAGLKKENQVGRQRGRVLSKDQDRTTALANRAKIPSQDKQPHSPTPTTEPKEQIQGNESKPKEQQYRATKEVENANDNRNPNSEHVQGAKDEAQRVRFMSKEQREAQQPKQHANDNQQDNER